MNDLTLYEKMPESNFPVRLLDYVEEPYRFSLHWHEHTEIHFIFQGQALLRCGDEQIALSENDCVIINGNELHQGLEGKCSYGCMILPPSFFDDTHIVFQRLNHDGVVADFFAKIYASFRAASSGYRHEIKGYTHLLVAYLAKHYAQETLSESLYLHRLQKLDKVNSAIRYINENYTEKITTAELAGIVHLSEGHFCCVFREATGMTAKAYINALRIRKASELLSHTDMTVTEAALCCGFSDPNYFARLFRKNTGKTPFSLKR